MLAHKLVLDDVDEQPFKLIALHGSVEEYKLAFLLNKHLGLQLSRTRDDLDFDNASVKASFALYHFYDSHKYCDYYFVSNKSIEQSKSQGNSGSLFEDGHWESSKARLLPEFKSVDFFLKIEEENGSVSEKILLDQLKQIPQLSTTYLIGDDQIKCKQNLIFD